MYKKLLPVLLIAAMTACGPAPQPPADTAAEAPAAAPAEPAGDDTTTAACETPAARANAAVKPRNRVRMFACRLRAAPGDVGRGAAQGTSLSARDVEA